MYILLILTKQLVSSVSVPGVMMGLSIRGIMHSLFVFVAAGYIKHGGVCVRERVRDSHGDVMMPNIVLRHALCRQSVKQSELQMSICMKVNLAQQNDKISSSDLKMSFHCFLHIFGPI